MAPADVTQAFEILLEEIQVATQEANDAGAAALRQGDYENAQQFMDRARKMREIWDELIQLKQRWADTVGKVMRKPKAKRRPLPRGQRTPEKAFHLPILTALEELGGRGEIARVLNRVYELMRDRLKDVDHQPVPSDPHIPRWRNTAQWARYIMRQEGILSSDSPRGVWEITLKGRQYLRNWKDQT